MSSRNLLGFLALLSLSAASPVSLNDLIVSPQLWAPGDRVLETSSPFSLPLPSLERSSSVLAPKSEKRQNLTSRDLSVFKQATGPGKCTDSQIEDINAWFADVITLCDAAANALVRYSSNEVARLSLGNLLGVKPKAGTTSPENDDHRLAVLNWFVDVSNTAKTGTNPLSWILCGEEFMEQQTADSIAHTAQGKDLEITDSDGTKRPALLREVKGFESVASGSSIPFWWAEAGTYVFRPADDPGGCEDGLRGWHQKSAGATSVRLIGICESEFERIRSRLSDISIQAGSWLSSVTPASLTLLHELIHLVRGGSNSPDTQYGRKNYDWSACAKSANDAYSQGTDPVDSPECASLFAFEMWAQANYNVFFVNGKAVTPPAPS